MPLPLLIPAAIAASQAGLGLYQTLRSSKLAKDAMARYEANKYSVPAGMTSAVNMAARQAQGTRLAGQDVMEQNLAAGTAQAVGAAKRAASTPSQVLAATVESYAQQQENQRQIDLAASQDYERRQQMYQNTLMQLAPYQQKVWEYNTLYPVQAQLNKASAMGAAGSQNIGTALQSGMSLLGNQQYLNSIKATGATPPPTIPQTPINFVSPQAAGTNPWWGGGVADTSIQDRQGLF
jgi:hypothetical protein